MFNVSFFINNQRLKSKSYKTQKGAYKAIYRHFLDNSTHSFIHAILTSPELGCENYTHIEQVPFDEPAPISFSLSKEWIEIRSQALVRDKSCCQLCGASKTVDNNVVLEVDHIKERASHPELALQLNNLQTLCSVCHRAKTNNFNRKK